MTTQKNTPKTKIADANTYAAMDEAFRNREQKPGPYIAALINAEAGQIAEYAHGRMAWLRDKLNEAMERLEEAHNAKDAWLAMSWLGGDLWHDTMQAKAKLETLAGLLERSPLKN